MRLSHLSPEHLGQLRLDRDAGKRLRSEPHPSNPATQIKAFELREIFQRFCAALRTSLSPQRGGIESEGWFYPATRHCSQKQDNDDFVFLPLLFLWTLAFPPLTPALSPLRGEGEVMELF